MGGRPAERAWEVRLYDPARDAPGVRRCIVALQDHERALAPDLLPGESMADGYLRHVLSECGREDGRLFVAELAGDLAGFVAVMARKPSDELDEEPYTYAYIHDLVVLEEYRGEGLGRALLDAASAFAAREGARLLRLHVLAANEGAVGLYRAAGFRERELLLERTLEDPGGD